MSSGVTLDTLQDKQMLDDFAEAKIGGICGILVDRYVNFNITSNSNSNSHSNSNRSIAKLDQRSIREPASQIWYIDANNLYGYAMMHKLPYKDFEHQGTCFADTTKSLDKI